MAIENDHMVTSCFKNTVFFEKLVRTKVTTWSHLGVATWPHAHHLVNKSSCGGLSHAGCGTAAPRAAKLRRPGTTAIGLDFKNIECS